MDAFKEIGVKDGENAFIVDFDLKKFNPKKIYENRNNFNFEYKPPKDRYDKLLVKGKNKYLEGFKKKTLVEAIIMPFFYDVELKENQHIGKRYVVNRNRAEDLAEKGLVKIIRDEDE